MLNTSPPKTIQMEKRPKKISLTIFTICLLSSQHVFIEAKIYPERPSREKGPLVRTKRLPIQMMVSMKKRLLGDTTYHDLLIPTDKAYLGSIEPIRTFPSNTSIAV